MSDPKIGLTTGTARVRFNLAAYAAEEPTLHLLVMLGSSSRGDAGGRADMEFAYLADPGFDEKTFQQLARSVTGLTNITAADLKRAPTTAFRAAREGALIFERTPGEFAEFRERAIHNWCELAPVLNAAYDRIDSTTHSPGSR